MNINRLDEVILNFKFEEIPVEDRLRLSFNVSFANCIIKRRRELGWTQEVLAQKSGVNRVTIAKLEKYQRTVSVDVMLRLLNALGLSIQFKPQESIQNQ